MAFSSCDWVSFSMFVHAALSSAVRSDSWPAAASFPDLDLSPSCGAGPRIRMSSWTGRPFPSGICLYLDRIFLRPHYLAPNGRPPQPRRVSAQACRARPSR